MMIGLYLFLKFTLIALVLMAFTACKPSTPFAPSATPATPQAIKQQIENLDAPLSMIHVWATWCDPCREEFPELIEVINHFPQLNVILISADAPNNADAVVEFLTKHKSPVDSLISTELNQAFIETLSPNWGGALPSTFLFKNGKLVSEWEGKRTVDEYIETIDSLL